MPELGSLSSRSAVFAIPKLDVSPSHSAAARAMQVARTRWRAMVGSRAPGLLAVLKPAFGSRTQWNRRECEKFFGRVTCLSVDPADSARAIIDQKEAADQRAV